MIYIVVKEQGEYSDYSWDAKRAFTDEGKAKAYAEKMSARHVVFADIANKIREWESAYKEQNPQPPYPELPEKPKQSEKARLLAAGNSPETKPYRQEFQRVQKALNKAWNEEIRILGEAHGVLLAEWYEAQRALKMAFIRENFSKQLAEYEISEDKLEGYFNWYYDPEWKIHPIPLDDEPPQKGEEVFNE